MTIRQLVNSSIRQFRLATFSPGHLVFACCAVTALLCASALADVEVTPNKSIVYSKHNLSASGPGAVKATTESEICIFCHTPHSAKGDQPLWNRSAVVSSYNTYTSQNFQRITGTLKAGQPTGKSKLCLSCHDGTIALGSVTSRSQPISMAGGMTTIPAGTASNLGTDLADDHPISFNYNTDVVNKSGKLKSPASLPSAVRLDAGGEMQCTTCHEAHNNQYGKFLVMANTNSELCNTCHTMGTSEVTQHLVCNSCHKTHTAPSGPYILQKVVVADTCTSCHNGLPGPNAGPNIALPLSTVYNHETKPAVNLANHIPNNADCKDCHESHTMKLSASGTAVAPAIQGSMGKIDGITIIGGVIPVAQYQYEVCFKCHADNAATVTPLVTRQITQANLRLKFNSDAISSHPVAFVGKNTTNVPSLRPPLSVNSLIYCTDCHGSDASKKAGGNGADGPHGSSVAGLLLAQYQTADFTPYATTAYALCFKCHDNTLVVADSGPFPKHKLHVQDNQAPCSTCHDSHGVASSQGTAQHNAALINFDTSIVFPDDITHTIQFNHNLGDSHGTCTLKCHNKNHNALAY